MIRSMEERIDDRVERIEIIEFAAAEPTEFGAPHEK
jgi:hypothetical protein